MGAVVDWTQARCLGEDPELFFEHGREEEAKTFCAECPVREPCLAYALRNRQDEGVWGGLTEQERARLRLQATPGGAVLELVTYTTRARSTGSICSAGRTATGWGTVCETHSTRATTRSRTAAEYAVSRPEEWCAPCERSSRKD